MSLTVCHQSVSRVAGLSCIVRATICRLGGCELGGGGSERVTCPWGPPWAVFGLSRTNQPLDLLIVPSSSAGAHILTAIRFISIDKRPFPGYPVCPSRNSCFPRMNTSITIAYLTPTLLLLSHTPKVSSFWGRAWSQIPQIIDPQGQRPLQHALRLKDTLTRVSGPEAPCE